MSWIETQDRELLETALKHLECCVFASSMDGKFYWANLSFLEWSGYTLFELQSMTWMDMSVRDGSLSADINESKKLDDYQQSYAVRKQYIPKQAKPVWGTLRVLRYPAHGEIACCICTWHPLHDDSKESFYLAVEAIGKMSSELQKLNEMVNSIEARSMLESTVVMAMKLAIKYPKSAWIVFVSIIGVVGGNAGFDLLVKVMNIINAEKVQ